MPLHTMKMETPKVIEYDDTDHRKTAYIYSKDRKARLDVVVR